MTIYDVLVANELLPAFTNDNPRLPADFWVLGPAEGPAGHGTKRMAVRDDAAPPWTEGKLLGLAFTSEYDAGDVVRVTISDRWVEVAP